MARKSKQKAPDPRQIPLFSGEHAVSALQKAGIAPAGIAAIRQRIEPVAPVAPGAPPDKPALPPKPIAPWSAKPRALAAPAAVAPAPKEAAPLPPTEASALPTKEAALDALRASRSWLVSWGRYLAIKIAREQGSVYSRQIYDQMEAMGLFVKVKPSTGHWLGVVFASRKGAVKLLEKTGREIMVKTEQIHERPQPIWQLTEAGQQTFLPEPPTEPPPEEAGDTEPEEADPALDPSS